MACTRTMRVQIEAVVGRADLEPSSRKRITEVSGGFASRAAARLAIELPLAGVDLVEAAADVVVAGALALERVDLPAELDHPRLGLLGLALGRRGLRLGRARVGGRRRGGGCRGRGRRRDGRRVCRARAGVAPAAAVAALAAAQPGRG